MGRYIDADKIVITAERGVSVDTLLFIPMIDVHRSIDATPTADVVEVVRCKDCKHRNPCGYKCLRDNLWHDDADYCSYGERIDK